MAIKFKPITYVAVSLIAISFIAYKKLSSPKILDTYRVQIESFKDTLVLDGVLKTSQEADLSFEIPGRVVWIGYEEGDRVKQGQAIAQVDTNSLKEDLNTALNNAIIAQTKIYEFDEIHKDDRDDPDTIHARDQLETAKVNADVAVEKARVALSKATIYSPIDGRIASIDIELGEYAVSGVNVVSIFNEDSKIIFKAELDEEDISKVNVGDRAEITLDSYENLKFDSQLIKISPRVTINKSGDNVVMLEFEMPENEIKKINYISGLKGEAQITLKEKDIIGVPFESVIEKNGNNYLYVYDNGKAKLQQVTIGDEFGNYTEIREGINIGDIIIIEKVSDIKEGQKVKLR